MACVPEETVGRAVELVANDHFAKFSIRIKLCEDEGGRPTKLMRALRASGVLEMYDERLS